MIQEIGDVVEQIYDRLAATLDPATEAIRIVEQAGWDVSDLPVDGALRETLNEFLQTACESFTTFDELLSKRDGILGKLKEKLKKHLRGEKDDKQLKARDFVRAQLVLLDKAGLKEPANYWLKRELLLVAREFDQFATKDENEWESSTRESIRLAKERICAAKTVVAIATGELVADTIKGVVKVIAGGSVVMLDIAMAATAPDVTGYVAWRCARSCWLGGTLVKSGVDALKDLVPDDTERAKNQGGARNVTLLARVAKSEWVEHLREAKAQIDDFNRTLSRVRHVETEAKKNFANALRAAEEFVRDTENCGEWDETKITSLHKLVATVFDSETSFKLAELARKAPRLTFKKNSAD